MSADYPQRIDPWQAAAREAEFSGEVALADLPRLSDVIVTEALAQPTPQGEDYFARFSAAFTLDARKRPLIDVHVEALVPLRCQRTLQVFAQALEAQSQVVIVATPEEGEAVDESLDPVLLEQPQLELRDLIEEEILLALPLVPVVPGSEEAFEAAPEQPQEPTRKAFAGLGDLLAQTKQTPDTDS